MGSKSDMRRPADGADPKLFISYRVSDTGPTATWLFKELAEAYGAERVFLDHERLEGGTAWPEQLEAMARLASVMLVLIGEGWLRTHDPKTFVRRLDQEGDWVRKEIEVALATDTLVVPLLVEGAERPAREAFATVPSLTFLADRQMLTLRRKDWSSDLGRLLELLDARGFVRRALVSQGVPPEQLEALVQERMTPLQELTAAQKRLISRLEKDLELNQRQMHAALEAAGKAEVQPELIAAKLGEIAGHYKTLRKEVQPAPGDDKRAKELKARASQAIEDADLKRADRLIGGGPAGESRSSLAGSMRARWGLGIALVVGAISAGGYSYVRPAPSSPEVGPSCPEDTPNQWKTAVALINDCDRLAANPFDSQKRAPGVNFDDIDTVRAIPACKLAVACWPQEARFAFQYGRVLAKAGDSDDEAVAWYSKAAKQGYAAAQNNLGEMYRQKRGVPYKSFVWDETVAWYRKAAEEGYVIGQHNLGRSYAYGRGVAKDEVEAVRWYRKAAEQGYDKAQYDLGKAYENGFGLATNEAKAFDWYRKAAEQGDAAAQNSLGKMYESGRGVATDVAKAVDWYRKAAEQGVADAQNSLGQMYENGRGTLRNEDLAIKWYRKADDQAFSPARANLIRLGEAK